MSFLTLAAATLSNATELPDIPELARHVVDSIGKQTFGHPRVPGSVALPELPRAALSRTWGEVAQILSRCRAAEWPALLGAAAYNLVSANRRTVPPPVALKVLLEAAVPMSRLDPATVEQSGIPAPLLTGWNMRAFRAEGQPVILARVRDVMPMRPERISGKQPVLTQPKIAFLIMAGPGWDVMIGKDSDEIGGLFHGRVQVTTLVPDCDILFVYCTVERSGKIAGQQLSLRELIGRTGATVVVVALEVRREILESPEFRAEVLRPCNPAVNLVITNNRNGEAFGRFFRSLFQLMWTGVTMPRAWVTLAPQAPQQPPDIPGTICLMGAGQVMFGRNP
jgi:hypothetical protein